MNLPEDFRKKMQDMLGGEWQQFLECYENDRYQALRINPLKKGLTAELRASLLQKFGAEKQVPWELNGYYYSEEARPGKHAYHEAGLYYIQEPSAMSAAALLAPKPGMRVLDLCAAPGGKTTQLAAALQQKGLLIANEIHPARCKILSGNVERMGIRNAIVTNEDSARLAERFPSYFHAILVDAPCSGEGMFRKNPDAMEEWSKEQVLVCAKRQREILENAAAMLLPGGTMVYSTCTFSKEENEDNIDWFLEQHPEFSVKEVDAPWFEKNERQGTFRLWPQKLCGEGHFVAVMKKAGELPEIVTDDRKTLGFDTQNMSDKLSRKNADKKSGKNLSGLDGAQMNALEEFCSSSLSPEVAAWILNGALTLFGDQLFRLPDGAPNLSGLRVLRAGLHIGEFKKNRFEPSHALALSLSAEEANCSVSLAAEDARTRGFLRGESIFLQEGDTLNGAGKGWCLVCVDGCSIGWGKLAGNQIKNHYPKGLRKDID
jgi:NOL1/NOP2/sun family putative RNA methylase